jgi:hypothetical protein
MRQACAFKQTSYLLSGKVALSGLWLRWPFDVRGMGDQSVFIGPDENHPKMAEFGV